jgi:hypothetical protein
LRILGDSPEKMHLMVSVGEASGIERGGDVIPIFIRLSVQTVGGTHQNLLRRNKELITQFTTF